MFRYARLLWIQVRASLLLSMQYRHDFIVDGILSVFWAFTALVPMAVAYHGRATIAGWSWAEALLVLAWFTLLQGILEGAINPSLVGVVEHIRRGTLDFVLIKPADAQFLVSTSRFLPWRGTNVFVALAIFVYAFHCLGRGPSLPGTAVALVLLFNSTLVLYSLWILTVSAAFYVVRVDNLTYLFASVFDAARWPATIFKGIVRWIFTFVIPLALMTTYPARALLGSLPPVQFVGSFVGALLFAGSARWVWLRSIRRYSSASS